MQPFPPGTTGGPRPASPTSLKLGAGDWRWGEGRKSGAPPHFVEPQGGGLFLLGADRDGQPEGRRGRVRRRCAEEPGRELPGGLEGVWERARGQHCVPHGVR